MLCRHCLRANVNRPRGLCWCCYYAPGVRALYPSTSRYARGVIDTYAPAPLDAAPTTAYPGSAAKLAVLERRAALGLALFHPQDEALDLHCLDSVVVPLIQPEQTGRHVRRVKKSDLQRRTSCSAESRSRGSRDTGEHERGTSAPPAGSGLDAGGRVR